MRRRDRPGQQFFRVHSLLGKVHVDPVAGKRAAAEERHAVRVIPVQVAEQERAAERPAVQRERQLLQSCARIQHDRGRLPCVGQSDARGMPAVVQLLGAVDRCRAASTAKISPHRYQHAPGRAWPR
jgi:hypothetical protein